MKRTLEIEMVRVIKIHEEYLEKETVDRFIRPVVDEGSTIELPPAQLPFSKDYFSSDSCVMLEIESDFTLIELEKHKWHLPADLYRLLEFAVNQGFKYIRIELN